MRYSKREFSLLVENLSQFLFQVWFQNRRAKFRRNERSLALQQNSSNKSALTSLAGVNSRNAENVSQQPLLSHHQPPPSTSDLQYVLPWKCSHYPQQELYSTAATISSHLSAQGCGFLPPSISYCTSSITPSTVCSHIDMASLRYRTQEFAVPHPHI